MNTFRLNMFGECLILLFATSQHSLLYHSTYSKAVNSIPDNTWLFFGRVIGGRVSIRKKQCAKTGGQGVNSEGKILA